ncbi:Protease 2 [Nymphaea thermarum]|nr:Protease 2 [Nymphaea thermarum]
MAWELERYVQSPQGVAKSGLYRHQAIMREKANGEWRGSLREMSSLPKGLLRVMPDAVVDYDLLTGKWHIVQQQNILHERTRILYGAFVSSISLEKLESSQKFEIAVEIDDDDVTWNDLSQYYACEYYDVLSKDDAIVPLTKTRRPWLAAWAYGAYGELLDKRWRTELKSFLDHGWVVACVDVRGGGGKGKRWHHDGRLLKKLNSVHDYIACATFLMDKEIMHQNKLAGWGYSAGGFLLHLPSTSNQISFVPLLDVCNTLLHPVLPLSPADYEEFGYPGNFEVFQAIRQYSPYGNIEKDMLYSAVLVTSSFGVWEAAKWVARVREHTVPDPARPILLNLTTDMVEENSQA